MAKKNLSSSSLFFNILSVVFHPVFVPALVCSFLIYGSTSITSTVTPADKKTYLMVVSYVTILFPLLVIFLLKKLDFIDSIKLSTIKERIAPLIASISLYFWVYWVFHKQFNAPIYIQSFLLGVFIATSLLFMATIFYKISMHATAWGGVCMLSILLLFTQQTYGLYFLAATAFITSLVCIARIQLKEHNTFEIISGLLLGIISQLIAYFLSK